MGNLLYKLLPLVLLLVVPFVHGCATFEDLFGSDTSSPPTNAVAECQVLNPETRLHHVVGCFNDDKMLVKTPSGQWIFDISSIENKTRQMLLFYLAETNYPLPTLQDATIDVWLFAPVFRPDQAEFVVTVQGGAANFGYRTKVEEGPWQIKKSAMFLLANRVYPTRAAKKSGVLAVHGNPWSKPDELKSLLEKHGEIVEGRATGSFVLEVGGFNEPQTLASLNSSSFRHIIQGASLIPAAEVDGYRVKLRAFSFFPDQKQKQKVAGNP